MIRKKKVDTPYCENDLCKKVDKYCCGHNECCFVWTVWYLWLAFSVGVLIGIFCFWKYFLNKKSREFSKKWSAPGKSSFKKNDENSLPNDHFTYMPLKNLVFIENKVNDNLIHVSVFFF